MTAKLKTSLFCLHCNKETSHTIIYRGRYLEEVKCNVCGNEIRIDREKLVETYTSDFIDRVLTKPHRLTKEMKQDLSQFLKSLPIRILTKPYRIAREIEDVLSEKEDKKQEKTRQEKRRIEEIKEKGKKDN